MNTLPMNPPRKAAYDEIIQRDRYLLDRVLGGEARAQREFVTRFARLIYQTLHATGIPRDDIDDVYQSVQVHLWSDDGRRLRLWRGDGALGGYVAAITARFARTYLCDTNRRARLLSFTTVPALAGMPLGWDPADPQPGPEEQLLHSERITALRALLRGLPGRDAELLYRRYTEDQTYAEIAISLGMTVSHVGVALFRAEARLRRRFAVPRAAQPTSTM